MQKAIARCLAPGWRRWIADLGFRIWDLDGERRRLGAVGLEILQRGVSHSGNDATRGAKLVSRIMGPSGAGTALQIRSSD